MIRIDIDQRILDREESADQLRRKIYDARIEQARLEGHAAMRAEVAQAEYLRGYNQCMADLMQIIGDFAKGNRS